MEDTFSFLIKTNILIFLLSLILKSLVSLVLSRYIREVYVEQKFIQETAWLEMEAIVVFFLSLEKDRNVVTGGVRVNVYLLLEITQNIS